VEEVLKHSMSIVIPVYRGESTLPTLVREIAPYFDPFTTPNGHLAWVDELLLVHDDGPDQSDAVIARLEKEYPQVRALWLSRNFGQHAATIAGLASAGGDWIITMDEDGQHDPADIPGLLDVAVDSGAHVVYARPTNRPPHSPLRSLSSRMAKQVMARIGGRRGIDPRLFNSYRLLSGEIGRSVAAYAGAGVYLDVALGWITTSAVTAPATLRLELRAGSGYSYRTLAGHFWTMILSSGTRALRLVSVLGVTLATSGIAYAVFLLNARLIGGAFPEGWTSIVVVTLVSSGAVLISLGVMAEYLGIAVNMAMGKPPYLLLGKRNASHSSAPPSP
jgi:undecaprenyl-phosphate 4-deoxy-4-formamido-L-arabinose transferase